MVVRNPDVRTSDERILVLAPFGQDAQMAADVLARAAIEATACADIGQICAEFRRGAGALLIAYEALAHDGLAQLRAALDEQPPWSDVPVFVFMPASATAMAGRANGTLDALRNVTLVERPVRMASLVSSLKSALRARRRQYEVRDLMEELRTSNHAKDSFVAAVSHELRTPLNAILGWAATLKRTGDPARAATAVEVIERNGHVLSQLVEDLLDVARVATGSFRLSLASVDMRAVVTAAADAVRPTAEAKGVRLQAHVQEQVPAHGDTLTVRGDSIRLQQVVWNLLWNAVKFTGSGGSVHVGVRAVQREAGDSYGDERTTTEVVVTDTGAGIAPEFLPHVFEPFRQAPAADGARTGGLGLGLAIVRHLVELHGGSIAVHSDGIGRGATFTVRIPALTNSGTGDRR